MPLSTILKPPAGDPAAHDGASGAELRKRQTIALDANNAVPAVQPDDIRRKLQDAQMVLYEQVVVADHRHLDGLAVRLLRQIERPQNRAFPRPATFIHVHTPYRAEYERPIRIYVAREENALRPRINPARLAKIIRAATRRAPRTTEVHQRLNKVEICGVDTATLPMLSAREMRQLLLKVKSGDEAAREEFIRSNLRLVLSIVQRFSNRSEMMDDLFQVGCIGLIKAIDNFDLRHEVRFSTYAVPMIIGEIRRHLRDNNAIRVSRSLRDTAYKALQARNRLAETNGREPTLAEVAAELSLTEEAVAFALEAIQEPVSLFEPVYRDDGDAVYVIDQLSDERTSDGTWLDHIALNEGMRHLTEREMRILKLRFFVGKTQMEVSREIGISQAQVSRLEKAALKQLQKFV